MNRMISGQRMALAALIACTAMLGGCGSDDDSGGGGGSKIKAPPTARPTLTGMATIIDVSGGNATAGNAVGGGGGEVFLVATNGLLVPGAAGAPAINANFLAPTLAVDNTVTYADLIGISAGNFYLDTATDTAHINLFGFDFHLPSGATLNLSDAPAGTADNVVIRTHGTGDFIRIDGTVTLGRAGAASVNFTLQTGPASGVAISVNGNINGNGAAGFSAADLDIVTGLGGISIGGSITLRGVDAALPTAGGVISVSAGFGNVHVAAGMFVSDGGDGFGTGNGGAGGTIQGIGSSNRGTQRFPWGMRANGGDSTSGTGGSGGDGGIALNDLAEIFVPFEFNGGDSTNASGGDGGELFLLCSFLKGVAAGIANGGDGADTGAFAGGDGGFVELMASAALQSFALDFIANGGSGTTGGNGGAALVAENPLSFPVMGPIDQVLIDVMTQGGEGANLGGDGGGIECILIDGARNLTLRADSVGGNATGATSTGGDGGGVFLQSAMGGYSVSEINIEVIAHGGDALTGSTGGDGGGAFVQASAGVALGGLDVTVSGTANGGTAETDGGNGGSVQFSSGIQSSEFELDFVANGGRATDGEGGTGGALQVGGMGAAILTGSFTALGGRSAGVLNNGGQGGAFLAALSGAPFRLEDLEVDLTGGASDDNAGGDGGEIEVELATMLIIDGGTFITNGGTGSTVSGIGFGGDAGAQLWATNNFDIIITGATFRGNGGNGAGGGGAGASGAEYGIEFTPDLDDDGPGAYCLVNATVEASGGNALVSGNGGPGGSAGIDNYDNNSDFSFAGVSEARGTWTANGGNGITMGGPGGFLDIDTNGDAVIVNATMRVNGGAGATGGSGGTVQLYADDDGVVGSSTVSVAGNIQANGGTGTANGGTGGSLQVYGIDATITISATLESNGGTGPAGGNGGSVFLGSNAQSLTITSSARIRANGGATNGDGGTININPQGTGGLLNPNYTEQAGSVIEANANGTGTAGTITRD